MSNAGPLFALGADLIDEFEKLEALGNTEQGSNAASLENDGMFRFRRFGFLSAIDDGLDGAEIFLPDNPGFSVDPLGFYGVVIGASFFDLLGDRGHSVLLRNFGSRVIHYHQKVKRKPLRPYPLGLVECLGDIGLVG